MTNSSVQLFSIQARGDRWVAVGTHGADDGATVVCLSGDATGVKATHDLVRKKGYYGRDVAWLAPDRQWVVGERAVPQTEGAMGHPLYEGFDWVMNTEGQVQSERTFGEPGVTGWRKVVAAKDRWFMVGSDEGKVVMKAQSSTQTGLWQRPEDRIDRAWDLAVREDGARGVQVGVLGEKGAITRGLARFLVSDAEGKDQWQWEGEGRWNHVASNGPRGWVLAGSKSSQAALIGLDSNGKERWAWTRDALDDAPASRVAAVAVQSDGRMLAVTVAPLGVKDARHPVLLRFSPEGRPVGEARTLRPDDAQGEVQVLDAVAFQNGWLAAGAVAKTPGAFRARVWSWTANAQRSWVTP